jgi:hypothetical protein
VVEDFALELPELLRRGQVAVEEEERRLEEGRLLRELLDRVSPVPQDTPLAVDEGDSRLHDGRVHVPGVVHADPTLDLIFRSTSRLSLRLELLERGGRDRVVDDGDSDRLARPAVRDGERRAGVVAIHGW